jgi:hypothetical protein
VKEIRHGERVHDFTGDYQSVQRFVRGLRRASPLPFRRMECEPGAENQIDFGKGAPIVTSPGSENARTLCVKENTCGVMGVGG